MVKGIKPCWVFGMLAAVAAVTPQSRAEDELGGAQAFLEKHCIECHDSVTKKGGLDLTELEFDLTDPRGLRQVGGGSRPREHRGDAPEEQAAPGSGGSRGVDAVVVGLARGGRTGRDRRRRPGDSAAAQPLRVRERPARPAARALAASEGRAAGGRRGAPVQQDRRRPRRVARADGPVPRARRTTRCGRSWRRRSERPEPRQVRYYARDQRSFTGKMKFSVFNTRPERATFPLLGSEGTTRREGGQGADDGGRRRPGTAGTRGRRRGGEHVRAAGDQVQRASRRRRPAATGCGSTRFRCGSGRARARSGGSPTSTTSPPGERPEPVTIYAETPPRLLRRLGSFDVSPEPVGAGTRRLAARGRNDPPRRRAAVPLATAELSEPARGEGRVPRRGFPLAGGRGPAPRRVADGGTSPALRRPADPAGRGRG